MRTPALVFLWFLALLPPLQATSARAQAVAVLPSVGTASDADRKAVDSGLRKVLGATDGVDLQGNGDTKRHVLSMAEMGLICVPDDIPCMTKLGIAADVALLLVPVVNAPSGDERGFAIEIAVIDVGSEKLARTARATLVMSERDKVEDLVDDALGRSAAVVDPEPPADPPPKDPPPAPPEDTGGPSLSTIGFGIAGVSGGLLVLAAGGATFCELAFAGIVGGVDAGTRADVIRPAGIGLWITSAVAAVGVGSGLVLALATREPEVE